MKRTRLVFSSLALGLSALLLALLFRHAGHSAPQESAGSSDPARSEAIKPAPQSAPPMPVAMRDPATYCANRLRDIKADPKSWEFPEAWIKEYGAAQTDEQRREVVGLARQVDARFFLALLSRALESKSADLRLSAARKIGLLSEDFLPEGVRMGVAAPEAEIRDEVLTVASNALPALRPTLLGVALESSQFPATRLQAAQLLMERPDQPSFEVLLKGLDDEDPSVRQSIAAMVKSQVGQQFASSTAALTWWHTNSTRFDGMMLEIPASPAPAGAAPKD